MVENQSKTTETKIVVPKVTMRRPELINAQKKRCESQYARKNSQKILEERLINRKSTPRPSILLLNGLGEGKIIQLDLDALKSLSKKRRRESKLSIKAAQNVIQEEIKKSSFAARINNTLEFSPTEIEEQSLESSSSSSDDESSEILSTVSSLKPEDLEFLVDSPDIDKCLHKEAITVSNIKVFNSNSTPIKEHSPGTDSSPQPLQSTVAKRLVKDLMKDDLTRFIFVKVYGKEKLPSSIKKNNSKSVILSSAQNSHINI